MRADAQLLADISALHADYAAAVDAADWDAWVALFTEDGVYRVTPRENFERGFPLATLALQGRGMLKDRVYAIRETLFHDPCYQRHVLGPPRVLAVDEGGARIRCEANYAVFRTKPNKLTEVFNVGRTLDELVRDAGGGLRFARRECIYDSEMIPNSLIYPL